MQLQRQPHHCADCMGKGRCQFTVVDGWVPSPRLPFLSLSALHAAVPIHRKGPQHVRQSSCYSRTVLYYEFDAVLSMQKPVIGYTVLFV